MSARYSLSVLLCLAMFAGCAAVSPAPASAEEAW